MEIEKEITRQVRFDSLSTGDVFLDEDEDAMMVVERCHNLGSNENYFGYAILLRNGWVIGFDADEKVIKVSAKLIVTD